MILKKIRKITPAIKRHIKADNYQSYERILNYIFRKDDVWKVTQIEYALWWDKRSNTEMIVSVKDKVCQIKTKLNDAVIERYPGNYISTRMLRCPDTKFSGEVYITIDYKIPYKTFFIELLKREGILNYKFGNTGDFFLSYDELGPVIKKLQENFFRSSCRFSKENINYLLTLISNKLAKHYLPLLRIWYHPYINGKVMKAVFSTRFDVDRAITNLEKIKLLETKYNMSSTIYIRPTNPFYSENEILKFAKNNYFSEIALHGEFSVKNGSYNKQLQSAIIEKQKLEKLSKQKVFGISMHGGEFIRRKKRNDSTDKIIKSANFLYDTTSTEKEYLPSKKIINGKIYDIYNLCHSFSDVKIEANKNYSSNLYAKTIEKFEEIYQNNGVFILLLHPVYFGFYSYIFKIKNLKSLIIYFIKHFIKANEKNLA
jgi:hypothetical protein